jgi:ADP-heptose:LPS heptosyltransferase
MNLQSSLNHDFVRLLEKFLIQKPIRVELMPRKKIRRIVIVCWQPRMGDLLLATPVFRAVRQNFPDAHLAVLTRSTYVSLLYGNRYLNELIIFYEPWHNWTWSRLRHFIKRLRAKYDLTVVLNSVSHSLAGDLLAWYSRAQFILGPEYPLMPGSSSNFLYNLRAPYSEYEKHQTERYLDIVRYLDMDTADLSEAIHLSKDEKQNALEYLNAHGLHPEDLIIAIHLASETGEIWEIRKFVQAAKYFSAKRQAKIVLFWDEHTSDLVEEFSNALPFFPTQVLGLSLREQAAVCYFCDVLICHDSDFMHLAASVGTPLVALFGSREPHHWKPIGIQFLTLRGEDGSLATLELEDVINLAEKLMADYPKTVRLELEDFDISEDALKAYLDI